MFLCGTDKPIVPDPGMQIDVGNFQGVSLNKKMAGIVIEVDYAKLLQQILKIVKRDEHGGFTEEGLIDAFMQLTREEETP